MQDFYQINHHMPPVNPSTTFHDLKSQVYPNTSLAKPSATLHNLKFQVVSNKTPPKTFYDFPPIQNSSEKHVHQ